MFTQLLAIFTVLVLACGVDGKLSMRSYGSVLRRAVCPRTRDGAAFVRQWTSTTKPNSRGLFGIQISSLQSRFPSADLQSRPTKHSTLMHMMSTTTTSDPSAFTPLESLSSEDKSIYQELYLLSERIRMLDASYYGRDIINPNDLEVSDEEYDALARKEAEICTGYPHLLALLESETGLGNKATRYGGRVGQLYTDTNSESQPKQSNPTKRATRSPAKKRIKRQHLSNAPMQSLDNAMDESEAVAWLNRVRRLLLSTRQSELEESSGIIVFPITIFAEPKIDGLSLSLRYELQQEVNDKCVYEFVWAATRGDGSQGEDVTDAVKAAWMRSSRSVDTEQYSVPDLITIESSGSSYTPPATIEIRGEVVLPQQSFEEFTNEIAMNPNSTSFSNARNAASGILLRSKEPTSDEELERTRWLQSRLRFYAYDMAVSGTDTKHSYLNRIAGSDMSGLRTTLTKYGFEVPTPVVNETLTISSAAEVNASDIPNLLEYHQNVMASRDESTSDSSTPDKSSYQIDGVVYKLSDFGERRICGSSSRTPRWAIAHKFPPLSAVTRLLDIYIQVGRTGALTPVAMLEPVDLGGVMVSKASLHNFHYAKKLLLSTDDKTDSDGKSVHVRSGISVLVSRAGDVIPQVMKRVFDDASEDEIESLKEDHDIKMIKLEPPTRCPACASPTTFEFISTPTKQRSKRKSKKDDNLKESDNYDEVTLEEDETGQVLRCSGPQLLCQPRAVNAMAYAYSRAGLDVKGVSKAKLQQLMEEEIIRYPADLFTSFGSQSQENSSKREEMLQRIAELPGWGNLSSENLADSIQTVASKGVSLPRFIYSLGIPFIGTQASQLIAASYKTAEGFLNALEHASSYNETDATDENIHPFVLLTGDDTSDKVKGIGPVALSSLFAYSKEKVLVQAAKDLAKALTINEEVEIQIDSLTANSDSSFKDMTIVFTGTLPISRTEAQNAVKARGAKSTPNTVSKSTNLVVVGEKGGKKAKQAEDLGVEIMDVEEFMRLIK